MIRTLSVLSCVAALLPFRVKEWHTWGCELGVALRYFQYRQGIETRTDRRASYPLQLPFLDADATGPDSASVDDYVDNTAYTGATEVNDTETYAYALCEYSSSRSGPNWKRLICRYWSWSNCWGLNRGCPRLSLLGIGLLLGSVPKNAEISTLCLGSSYLSSLNLD